MIIIKTKTGDIFVNDKEILHGIHNKPQGEFTIYIPNDGGVYTYDNVELVRYVSDAQAVDIVDKGSELEAVAEKLAKAEEANERYRMNIMHMYKVIDAIEEDVRHAFSGVEANAQDKDVPVEIRKRIMEYCTDIRCKVNSYYYQDMLDKLNKQKEL